MPACQRCAPSGIPTVHSPSIRGSHVSYLRTNPEPKNEKPGSGNEEEYDGERESVGGGGEHGRSIDESQYVTIFVLAFNMKMEQYTRNDVIHQATVYVPPNSQLEDFDEIIDKMLKEQFPGYTNGYECRCLKQDVLRSALIVTQMVNEKKLTPDEVTPGVILPLIGRVFVLLKGPHAPGNNYGGGGGGGGERRPTNNASSRSNDLMDASAIRPTIYHAPWSHAPPAPPPPNFYVFQAPQKKRKLVVSRVQSEAAPSHVNEIPRLQSSTKRPSVSKAVPTTLKRKRDEPAGMGEMILELVADSLALADSVNYVLSEQSQNQVSRPDRPILRASRRFSSVSGSVVRVRSSQQNNRSSQSRN